MLKYLTVFLTLMLSPSLASDLTLQTGPDNLAIGHPVNCGALKPDEVGCITIIGYGVSDTGMKSSGVRIGSGNVYLELTADGKASIVGANTDTATEKV